MTHSPGTSGSSSVPFRCLPARRNFSERSVRPSCFQMCLPALGFFPSSSAQATFDQPPPVVKAQYDPPLPQTSALPVSPRELCFLLKRHLHVALWMALTARSRTMFASNTGFSVFLCESSIVRLRECPVQPSSWVPVPFSTTFRCSSDIASQVFAACSSRFGACRSASSDSYRSSAACFFWSSITSLDVARAALSEVRLFNVMRLALTPSPCLQCIDSSTSFAYGMVVKGRGREVMVLNSKGSVDGGPRNQLLSPPHPTPPSFFSPPS